MGSTIVNLSFRNVRPSAVVDAVESELPQFAGFVSPDAEWTTLYGEAFESLDTDMLLQAARVLCPICHARAIACVVFDSDVLMIWVLDETGEALAAFNSCPDYFSDDSRASSTDVKDIATSIASMSQHVSARDIIEILEADTTFAEDKLESLGKCLGIPHLGWTYTTLDENLDESLSHGFVRLGG